MYSPVKRFFDLILILAVSPLFLLLFLMIYLVLSLKSNPIFTQKRIGLQENEFIIYKFKTMDNELILNKFCLFLRKSNLDEIPQVINILKGEMSLIGPRPLLPEYLPKYSEKQRKRHNVKPGITGWAQVKGGNSIDWYQRLDFDVYYAENQSFMMDLKILFLTFLLPFQGQRKIHFSEKFEG
jgi:lipopolysaccharide/colanic/teichoic acid biosynthesis glycosyltransferase